MKRITANKETFFQVVLLLVVSALSYLPRIGELQYYKDDWYYVLDGLYGGPAIFNHMFAIDRPARGPFFQAYFSIFGANPLPYHLGHYFWRLGAALAALWLFRQVWPRQTRQALIAALFFILYPGYLWWPSGIEYQPMVVSLCLQVLSIAFTVKAILTPGWPKRILLVIGSLLTGWGYLALVDYAIGAEFFRLALIFALVNREDRFSFLRKGYQAMRIWLYTSFLIPAGFLFWKIFLFTGERKVTDLSTQLAHFLDAPRHVLKLWLVGTLRDGLSVSSLAWIEPFSQSFWNLSPNEILTGLVFAALLITFVFFAFRRTAGPVAGNGKFEPLVVGFTACFFGVVPVVIANRYVDFGSYSHYSLPSSLPAALFFASLVAFISPGRMQAAFISLVVATAMLTHYTVTINVIKEIGIINSFWWQVNWRAPGIRTGTTLIVDYPTLGFDDQADNIWGPANLLYYPNEKQQEVPVEYELAALPMRGPELEEVFAKGTIKTGYRTHFFRYDVDQILVLSQVVEGACVRAVNGQMPVLSSDETVEIQKVAPYSRLDTLVQDPPGHSPSKVFGPEPEHGWCYYFEKVDAAVQQGDQESALSLADQALAAGLAPRYPVEWMPLLYTYMRENNFELVSAIGREIKKDEVLEKQACEVFLESQRGNPQISPEMIATVQFLVCHQ